MVPGESRDSEESRWWFGVAFFVGALVLTWGAYGLLQLVSNPQSPSSTALIPSTPELGGVYLLSAVVTGGLVLVVGLLAPVYSLCLYLDVRALREADSGWAPNRLLWGAVSLLHLVSFVFSAVQLVTIPAGAIYLYARHKRVGLRSGVTR